MGDYNRLEGVLTIPTSHGEVRMKRQIVPAVKAAFEDWLELSARKRISELRKKLGEEAYVENMMNVNTLSAAGKLRWGGEAWRMAIQDVPGVVQLVVLLCHETGQLDMTANTVMQIMNNKADGAVLVAAVKEVMDGDPNFLSPPGTEGTTD